MSLDYRLRQLTDRIDVRTHWRFGFAHYGVHRFLRIGKLGIRLWRIS